MTNDHDAIRARLEAVKQALRDNEVDVFNKQHHASWADVEYLLNKLTEAEARLAAAEAALRLATDQKGQK